jgi:serine/threonine protein kinase
MDKNENKNSKTSGLSKTSGVGGKVLASGGFGCVFSPALKCEGETKRHTGQISKLMSEKHATQEYEEINRLKEKLDKIRHFENYFLLYDATLCRPAKLATTDLTKFGSKCTALPKDKILRSNVNQNLDKLMSLNLPNGGLPVDDYIYANGSYEKLYNVHTSIVKLLKKGIINMNKKFVFHCDIKDSNVLIDDSSGDLKARLIDWGLSTEYTPFKDEPFPKSWRNRPLQFNVPFSVIIFSDSFVEKYTKFIKDNGIVKNPEEIELKPFVTEFIVFWMKERGAGHYRFINDIIFTLFSNDLTSIDEADKPKVIETQYTMDYLVDYIVNVLVHFTKFRADGTLNLREYLDNIFIQIVDIWGLISVYYPFLEMLSNNYNTLQPPELKIFNKIKIIFIKYLYNPRHEPINLNLLYNDLKVLGNLIYQADKGRKKTTSTSSKLSSSRASGIRKTRKNKHINSKTSFKFVRKPKVKRFKNPIYLSLK